MKLTKNIRKKQKKKKYEQTFSNLETFRLILKNTPFVVFCMLSSLTTIEQEQFPYWFDERHKCWLPIRLPYSFIRVGMRRKQTRVFLLPKQEWLDFYTEFMMEVNTSDIGFFNTNPNDNLCLNVEYYKSLHWYKWDVKLTFSGSLDVIGTEWLDNKTEQDVFDF